MYWECTVLSCTGRMLLYSIVQLSYIGRVLNSTLLPSTGSALHQIVLPVHGDVLGDDTTVPMRICVCSYKEHNTRQYSTVLYKVPYNWLYNHGQVLECLEVQPKDSPTERIITLRITSERITSERINTGRITS
jgi:hypothetical protein